MNKILLFLCAGIGLIQSVHARMPDPAQTDTCKTVQTNSALAAQFEYLPADREEYVRTILRNIKAACASSIIIRRLPEGQTTTFASVRIDVDLFGLCNWWYDPQSQEYILLVGETFLAGLSKEEQYFVLAHEVAHMECNHTKKKSCAFIASFGAGAMSFVVAAIQLSDRMPWLVNGAVSALAAGATGVVGYGLAKEYERLTEFEADALAVKRLGSKTGALAFFTRVKAHSHIYDCGDSLVCAICRDCCATHPDIDQRIAYVKSL